MKRFVLSCTLVLTALAVAACEQSRAPTEVGDVEAAFAKPGGGSTNPRTAWKLPLNGAGLGLVSDGAFAEGSYSVYSDGVCGVTGQVFTGDGSGDATLQTNNPRAKDNSCPSGARKMTVVYPAGDVAYPGGGTETMLVFLNVRNIWNGTTDIPVGQRQLRMLALNPTQTERCDAWRWTDETLNGVTFSGDRVWVERLPDEGGKRQYHVYTQDRGPDPVAGKNKAVCTTTMKTHNLSVDFVISQK